jgi:hypothetical protein
MHHGRRSRAVAQRSAEPIEDDLGEGALVVEAADAEVGGRRCPAAGRARARSAPPGRASRSRTTADSCGHAPRTPVAGSRSSCGRLPRAGLRPRASTAISWVARHCPRRSSRRPPPSDSPTWRFVHLSLRSAQLRVHKSHRANHSSHTRNIRSFVGAPSGVSQITGV